VALYQLILGNVLLCPNDPH